MQLKRFAAKARGQIAFGLILTLTGAVLGADAPPAGGSPKTIIIQARELEFLRKMTGDVVEASRVKTGGRAGESSVNNTGFTLIMPGGNGGYPSFWVRDFSMSLDSGFITTEEIRNQLHFIARAQNGPQPRLLKNGLIIPAFAIPDHINFDGGPVFYPGTYSSTDDQGHGEFGFLPPADDNYEFIHIAWFFSRRQSSLDFLSERVEGCTLLERITAAFAVPDCEANTGLVSTDDQRRAVGFGFYDGIYFTGRILFPSLLRYRAAGELADLYGALGKKDRAANYRRIQTQIVEHLENAFADPKRIQGWLMAATGTGRQPDVWGTLYALHLKILKKPAADAARQTIIDAVRRKTICFEGAVRHVPVDMDYSPQSAWEKTVGLGVNTYQNGAYWPTAAGWLIEAVAKTDPPLAAQLCADYIHSLQKNDFRLGPTQGAPWECFFPNGYTRNRAYMTSVTVPFAILSQINAGQTW